MIAKLFHFVKILDHTYLRTQNPGLHWCFYTDAFKIKFNRKLIPISFWYLSKNALTCLFDHFSNLMYRIKTVHLNQPNENSEGPPWADWWVSWTVHKSNNELETFSKPWEKYEKLNIDPAQTINLTLWGHKMIVAAFASQFHDNYLLSWCDVGIDVFEDRLEHGVIAHAQVLDLNLTALGPVLGHLRGVCRETNTGNYLYRLFETSATENRPLAASLLSILEAWLV